MVSLRHIIICLVALDLMVQATLGRPQSMVCLGHLHPGSCSPPMEVGSHTDDCEHDAPSAATDHDDRIQSHDCCCVDVQVSPPQAPVSKRINALEDRPMAPAVLPPPPCGAGPCRSLLLAQRVDAREASMPRDQLGLRAIVLQI